MTISDANMPKLKTPFQEQMSLTARNKFEASKPSTAASQSLKYLDAMATESQTPKIIWQAPKMIVKGGVKGRNRQSQAQSMVESQPSEFNL